MNIKIRVTSLTCHHDCVKYSHSFLTVISTYMLAVAVLIIIIITLCVLNCILCLVAKEVAELALGVRSNITACYCDDLVNRHCLRYVTRDCNPGRLFQSRDFGIEKCQSRDWVPDFKLVKISSNSLWSHDEFLNLDLSAMESCFDMWMIVNIFIFVVSCRMIQFHHYLM